MQISILQGSASGTALYVETQTPVTNINGLITIEIGDGTVVSGDFTSIDWENGPYFIKTETDPEGGTNYSISGVSQILSVPYSLQSKRTSHIDIAVSPVGDTLYIGSGDFVIIPGISAANAGVNDSTIVDIDGNVYDIITIGEQKWTRQNLIVSHLNDGTPIPNITGNSTWASTTTPAYCYFLNDSVTNCELYGALYNWYAVETGMLCPSGWHVPTDNEWIDLIDFLASDGHADHEGKAIKSTTGWLSGGNGTDDYDFTAMPGGGRDEASGEFNLIGGYGFWWTASETSSGESAKGRNLVHFSDHIIPGAGGKKHGFSVRCVKD